MWALDQAYAPRAERLLADTPLALLAWLAAGAAAVALLVEVSLLPAAALRAVVVTAGHGALLVTALAWAHVGSVSRGIALALLAVAAIASVIGPAGAIAYLLPAIWIGVLAARGHLVSLGLGTPVSLRALAAGVCVGAGLSSHLLVSASRTLGVRAHVEHPTDTLAWIAYDVGANVLAAECFFRGALFDRALRRWSFVTATTVATAAYLARYLVDPLLPKSAELVAGAVFYLALLGAANCWLLTRSQSLIPGLVSAALFFAAYRTLGAR